MGYQSSGHQFVDLSIIVYAPHKGRRYGYGSWSMHDCLPYEYIGYVYSSSKCIQRILGIRRKTANKTIGGWVKGNKGGNGKQLIKFAWPNS